jgi:hypothetical protein
LLDGTKLSRILGHIEIQREITWKHKSLKYNTLLIDILLDHQNTPMMKISYALIVISLLIHQLGLGQKVEYAYGKNYDIQIGGNVTLLLQKNAQAGQGKNQIGGGLFLDASYVSQKYKSIWESYINTSFSIQKEQFIPLKKGQDKIRLTSHYAFTTSYNSPWYTAVDFLTKTQFSPSYDGGAIANYNDSLNLLSQFLSPLKTEISVGEEYRIPQSPIYIFGGVALNHIYVNNSKIATYEPLDNKGISLGTLHGNAPDKKHLIQSGLTIKARYRGDIITKRLSYDTNFRFFIDLLNRESNFNKDSSPIDVEWINTINVTVINGFNITLKFDLLYDKDTVFVDDTENKNSFSKNGISTTANIIISVRKTFNTADE